jgi:hypothetical protein
MEIRVNWSENCRLSLFYEVEELAPPRRVEKLRFFNRAGEAAEYFVAGHSSEGGHSIVPAQAVLSRLPGPSPLSPRLAYCVFGGDLGILLSKSPITSWSLALQGYPVLWFDVGKAEDQIILAEEEVRS